MPDSPPPPESLSPMTTPALILRWFERVREQFQLGVLSGAAFNELLQSFQFSDAQGTLWTPGARTSQWYRWDGRQWTPGAPPERLQLPAFVLASTELPPLPLASTAAAPSEPRAVRCPKCGAANLGKKFCTKCGTKLPLA